MRNSQQSFEKKSQAMLDSSVRDEFPILSAPINGKPLIYLDNTATTHKPNCVIDRMMNFYRYENATVHRGVYGLSQRATDACEQVRDKVTAFIGANKREEIIFVKGTTEALNLISHGVMASIQPGDEILITEMEHHANIIPWQEVCKKTGALLKIAPIYDSGDIDINAFESLLSDKTKVVAFTHVSNVLGTINDVKTLTSLAKKVGAMVVIDGAQAVSHLSVNVSDIGCDFYCFSGHKMMGPTGVGVLYGRHDILKDFPPYQTGGDMIETVTFEETTFALPPNRFEGGTPAICPIIGLGEAVTFLENIGLSNIHSHEAKLLTDVTQQLSATDGVTIIGNASQKSAVVSFVMEGIHPHDAGTILDSEGIAVRVGQHCAQPLMNRYGLPATIRASFSLYNTTSDVAAFIKGVKHIQEVML